MSRVIVYFFRSYCLAKRSICCLRCSSIGKPCLVLMLSLGVSANSGTALSPTMATVAAAFTSLRLVMLFKGTFQRRELPGWRHSCIMSANCVNK